MREPIPSEEGLLFRSLRNVAQGSRPRKVGVIVFGLCIALLSDASAGDTNPPPRLLWEVKTAGGMDSFTELLPAGDKLVAMRRGVVYALDARTGKTCWRYPRESTASESFDGGWGYVVLAVRGDRVIIRGCIDGAFAGAPPLIEISLQSGTVLREYHDKLTFPNPDPRCDERPSGPLYSIKAESGDGKRVQVSVIDLDLWRETARFELDYGVHSLRTRGSMVYLIAVHDGEPFARALAVDLTRQSLHSIPLRCRCALRHYCGWATCYGGPLVLPDGTLLHGQSRFNAACGLIGTWPYSMPVCPGGDAVYVRDALGISRLDIRNNRKAWKYSLPWPHKASIGETGAIVSGGEVAVLAERGNLYILDSNTGALRAAIRTEVSHLACDAERVYVAEFTGLRAYSTHPVDPARPAPSDVGDPAYHLARCRAALRGGDFEAALRAMQGVGVAARLRKESRDEAADLLSRLARSPATVLYPERWHEVMLSEGWIAGELFMDEYLRLRHPGPLIGIGTRRAITGAAAMADDLTLGVGHGGADAFLAVEACKVLTGVRPVEKLMGGPSQRAYVAFYTPIEDETFSQLLPQLPKQASYLMEYYDNVLSPTQMCQIAEAGSARVQAAKLQMESMARGAGTEEKIVITRPASQAPPDEGVF